MLICSFFSLLNSIYYNIQPLIKIMDDINVVIIRPVIDISLLLFIS